MSSKNLVNPISEDAKKSRNFLQNATDTFHELLFLFLGAVLLGGASYSLFEGKNFLEGMAWAFKTAFVVGYGDTPPVTAGAYVTGVILMSFTMYVMVPLITALLTKKALENGTLKRLDAIADRLEATPTKAKKSSTKK